MSIYSPQINTPNSQQFGIHSQYQQQPQNYNEEFEVSQTFEKNHLEQTQHNQVYNNVADYQIHNGFHQNGFQEEFNETDPDFQDQSIQEIGNLEVNQKDLHSYDTIGFDRKFQNIGHLMQEKADPLMSRKIQQGQIDNLDLKAQMINQPKSISNYNSKNEIVVKLEDGVPLQMVYYDDETKRWELNQQVVEAIQSVRGSVSFISVMGRPKSGKTFLMNSLISNSNDPNTEKFKEAELRENKGLIIWSQPLYNPSTGTNMFFIDSQEYGTDQHRGELQQIQTIITLLISSLVLVNVKGELTSESLLPLADLHELQEYIDLDLEKDRKEELNFFVREELQVLFPKLLFVLRDFKDQPKKNGKNISFQQYLQNFLEDDETYIKASEQEKKIRRRIVKYFKTRDAWGLVSPVQDQTKLKNLNQLELFETDVKFQEGLKVLRKKVVQHQCKKELRGVFFSSTMMISFIKSILEDLNSNNKINLLQCYLILIENEYICTYNESVDTYNSHLAEQFADEKYKSFKDLGNALRAARDAALDNFNSLKLPENEHTIEYKENYLKSLLQMIQQKEELLINFNSELQKKMLEDIQKEQQKQQKLGSSQNVDNITKNYNRVLKDALQRCMGGTQESEPVTEFASHVMDEVVNLMVNEVQSKSKIISEKEKYINDIQKQLKDQKQQFEEEKKKLSEETKTKEKEIAKIQEENKTKIKNLSKEKDAEKEEVVKELEKIKVELEEEKKKSSKKGCECTIF